MKHFEISASVRNEIGKKASKKIRKDDNIPCVLYGGEKTIHFYTSQSAVRKFVYTPEVMFADIKLDGKSYYAMVQDIQFHKITDKIIHMDFYEIHDTKPVKIKIPVLITGSSPGVKAGGKLKQNLRKIAVKALMKDIPDKIDIDISALNIGDSIRVKDLKSEVLDFIDTKTSVIVSVITMRGASASEETAEVAEVAEETTETESKSQENK